MFFPTLIDDRKARHTAYTGRHRLFSRRERDRISQEDFLAISRALPGGGSIPALQPYLYILWLSFAVLVGMRHPSFPTLLVVLLTIVIIDALARRLLSGRCITCSDSSVIKAVLLGMARCPSCAEPLPEEPDERGCVVCRECRAAWRTAQPVLRCRFCRYVLAGLTPEPCGCAVCPECGERTSSLPGGCTLPRNPQPVSAT
jgi:hypothetical protein